MTLYIILIFIALCAGMAISVHAFGTGRQAQAHLPGTSISPWRTWTASGCCTPRPGNTRPSCGWRTLLQKYSANIDSYYDFTKPAHRRRTDAGRRLCDTQAGRVRAQAVRGCDGRPARVPILRLFPVLQRPDVHGQRYAT